MILKVIELLGKASPFMSLDGNELNKARLLSAAQIAERLEVSKSVVIGWLNRLKIAPGTSKGRMTNPHNFRHYSAPYGYRVKGGKLILNHKELKICRLVVELMDRQGMGVRATGRELAKHGFKNRHGKVNWGHYVVQQI